MDENYKPSPAAFKLRDTDQYLSVNWLEYFGMQDMEANMSHVREDFKSHHSSVKSARFVVLRVGEIKSKVKEYAQRDLHVKYLEESDYPSHAGIEGYTRNDKKIQIALSDMVKKDNMYLAER